MKVYLSAQWSRRDEIEGYAAVLRADGHEVVSRWHSELMGDDSANSVEDWAKWATADFDDIYKADCYASFTEPQGTLSRGGRHVEWGAALCMVKAMKDGICVVVGPVESQFYALASDVMEDFWDLRAALCEPMEWAVPRKATR